MNDLAPWLLLIGGILLGYGMLRVGFRGKWPVLLTLALVVPNAIAGPVVTNIDYRTYGPAPSYDPITSYTGLDGLALAPATLNPGERSAWSFSGPVRFGWHNQNGYQTEERNITLRLYVTSDGLWRASMSTPHGNFTYRFGSMIQSVRVFLSNEFDPWANGVYSSSRFHLLFDDAPDVPSGDPSSPDQPTSLDLEGAISNIGGFIDSNQNQLLDSGLGRMVPFSGSSLMAGAGSTDARSYGLTALGNLTSSLGANAHELSIMHLGTATSIFHTYHNALDTYFRTPQASRPLAVAAAMVKLIASVFIVWRTGEYVYWAVIRGLGIRADGLFEAPVALKESPEPIDDILEDAEHIERRFTRGRRDIPNHDFSKPDQRWQDNV